MKRAESFSGPERDGGNKIENALMKAGLSGVTAPSKDTKAYEKLVQAAKNYIVEVQKGEQKTPVIPQPDGENYFSHRKPPSSSSDSVRRAYHNQLALMLLGKTRAEISREDADRISDFAAYLTDNEEYVGTFRSK